MPLQGIKVIDLTEEISGPHCSMELGDAGAEVIKIEPLKGDWARSLGPTISGESALFLALNRNKRSIAVDMGQERGRGIVIKLVEQADVFLENSRPGTMDRLGMGYETLKSINPRLIYCSISTFGTSGPYKNRAASELEIQGMSGYSWFVGEPGEAPVRIGTHIASVSAGMFAFIGILAALYYRWKAKVGQKVEISMLGTLLFTGTNWLTAHYNPDSWGGFFATGPFDHAEQGYATKDKAIMFSISTVPSKTQKAWEQFCTKAGLSDLLGDPFFREKGMRMVGVGRDAQEWKPVIEGAFENRTSEEILEILSSCESLFGVFNTYEDIFSGPHVQAVEMVQEIKHPIAGNIKVTGMPWKFSKTPCGIRRPPPTLGQHTEEILLELGYSKQEIAILKEENVVV